MSLISSIEITYMEHRYKKVTRAVSTIAVFALFAPAVSLADVHMPVSANGGITRSGLATSHGASTGITNTGNNGGVTAGNGGNGGSADRGGRVTTGNTVSISNVNNSVNATVIVIVIPKRS